jgi:hypothetical protein
MVMPPTENVPKEVRGQVEEVTFYISATGVVTDLKVAPVIQNRGYARKFDEVMRGYTFKPARDAAGNKIASVLTMQVTIGSK